MTRIHIPAYIIKRRFAALIGRAAPLCLPPGGHI
jgi:hypothetical protein